MQPLTSQAREPENRYPDCLLMDITGEPIHQSQHINLSLDLCFNEQWVEIYLGRIKLGLKGGELRLRLEGGKIPLDCRELCSSLPIEISVERETSTADVNKVGVSVNTSGLSGTHTTDTTAGTTDKFELKFSQITCKGAEHEPAWEFQEMQGKETLKGVLKSKLAVMEITAKPCTVTASFEVSDRDIQLVDAEGLWQNLSATKRYTLNRYLVLRILNETLRPHISQKELMYE